MVSLLTPLLTVSLKSKVMNNNNSPISFNSISLSTILRSDWKWLLIGAIFAFFLSSILMSGWPEGLSPNSDYPFKYSGDSLWYAMQTKRVMEGWVFDNFRSGFPFGSTNFDFPGSDSGHYLILKLIGLVTGEYHSAINYYFLLGFSVTFIASFCVLRTVGLTNPFAFSAAILFDFLPFHIQRLDHLFYTWYFVVPVFYYIALRFLVEKPLDISSKLSLTRKLAYTICLIVLGTFGVYYALFGLILFAVVTIYGLIESYNTRLLRTALFASVMVVCGVMLNLAPNLMYKYKNGQNSEVAQRGIAEAETYGFKFAQLIIPRDGHRISSLNRVSAKYNNETPLINENRTSALGAIGTFGLFSIFLIIVRRLVGKPLNKTLIIISLIVIALFMFGTIGGFGSVFSAVVTTSFRGWNRISIFIGFGVLVVSYILVQTEIHKHFSGKRLLYFSWFASLVIMLVGIFDQTIPACKPCNEHTSNSFNEDREFIRSIELSLPVGGAIYQLPYLPFPEVPSLNHLEAYDLSVGFLNSTSLRWSFGGMKSRSGDLFYRALAKEPLIKQIDIIKRLGFVGIYLDRRGFSDNANGLIEDLTTVLANPPSLVRADGNVVFFRLYKKNIPMKAEDQSFSKLFNEVGYDHLGFRYKATFADGIDFRRLDYPSFVKDIQGLSELEVWGRWSDANLAPVVSLDFNLPLPSHFNLIFTAQAFGPNVNKDLVINIGKQSYSFKVSSSLTEFHKAIDLGNDMVTHIEFVPSVPVSPKNLNLSEDRRMLGIGISNLRFQSYIH